MITKGNGGLESWRTREDHPNYYIIANIQDTEKSSGDLRGGLYHWDSREKPSANADVKNCHE